MSIKEEIKQLFTSYQADFEKLNLTLVRNYYGLPCHMSMIGRVTALNTEKQFEMEFQPMFEALKQSRFHHAKYGKRSFSKLNSDQVMASIKWEFYKADDDMFSEFATIYNLKGLKGKWKIISVILHNTHKYIELAEGF